MKINWLHRGLIDAPHYTLCTNQERFDAVCKYLKVEPYPGMDEVGDARTHFFERKGKIVAVVCFFNYRKHDRIADYAMLVHEAVHIWQEVKKEIDEKSPSAEFEAYSVQRICVELFAEFEAQVHPRLSARKKRARKK